MIMQDNRFMKSNPILEEVWRTKDQLAAETGYDIDRFFESLRKWEAEHLHSISAPGQAGKSTLALNDKPARHS